MTNDDMPWDQAVEEILVCFRENKRRLDELLSEAAKLAEDPPEFARWMERRADTVLLRQEIERLHKRLLERKHLAGRDGDLYEKVPQEFLWEVTERWSYAALEATNQNLMQVTNKVKQNALCWVMDWTKDAIRRNGGLA